MALIICPECGGKVSDKANACIHCGYPISKNIELKTYSSVDRINKSKECMAEVKKSMDNYIPKTEFNIMNVNFPLTFYI